MTAAKHVEKGEHARLLRAEKRARPRYPLMQED